MQTYFPQSSSLFNYVHHSSFAGNSMPTSMVAVAERQQYPPSTATETSEKKNAVSIELENADIWKQFNEHETEMIITKPGRRMFPTLRYQVTGLDANATYAVYLKLVPLDEFRYKFSNGKWAVNGRIDVGRSDQRECNAMGNLYMHPDSPATGRLWMKQPISFHKIKLTNNNANVANGLIILNSMQKYTPVVYVFRVHGADPQGSIVASASFEESNFIAVTAYQNDKITQLKINHNPFAKGFREHGKHEEKRRCTPDDAADTTTSEKIVKKSKMDTDDVCQKVDQVEIKKLASSSTSPSSDEEMTKNRDNAPTPLATIWNPMTTGWPLSSHRSFFESATALPYSPLGAFNSQPMAEWFWHQRQYPLLPFGSAATSLPFYVCQRNFGNFGFF